jgi:hypothetical protein
VLIGGTAHDMGVDDDVVGFLQVVTGAAPVIKRMGVAGFMFTRTFRRKPQPSPPSAGPHFAVRRFIQPKLAVGPVDDPFEREADRVAERVASRQPAGALAGMTKPLSPDADSTPVPPGVADGIRGAQGGGSPLAAPVRETMEGLLRADFHLVRVHATNDADRLNRSLEARAFTVGTDIFFRRGEYRPADPAGVRLIAHELAHVRQQTAAPAPMSGTNGSFFVQRYRFKANGTSYDTKDIEKNPSSLKEEERGAVGARLQELIKNPRTTESNRGECQQALDAIREASKKRKQESETSSVVSPGGPDPEPETKKLRVIEGSGLLPLTMPGLVDPATDITSVRDMIERLSLKLETSLGLSLPELPSDVHLSYLEEQAYHEAVKREIPAYAEKAHKTAGFAKNKSAFVKQGKIKNPGTPVHELIHVLSGHKSSRYEFLNEGMTEYLTRRAIKGLSIERRAYNEYVAGLKVLFKTLGSPKGMDKERRNRAKATLLRAYLGDFKPLKDWAASLEKSWLALEKFLTTGKMEDWEAFRKSRPDKSVTVFKMSLEEIFK